MEGRLASWIWHLHTAHAHPQRLASTSTQACKAYPESVSSRVLFALGAWNPLGIPSTPEANNEAHASLTCRISALSLPAGSFFRPSFGFSEVWREPGFVVACLPVDRETVFEAVCQLAKDFRQGAIYEYTTVRPDLLRRRTVAVCSSNTVEAEVLCARCERPNFPFSAPPPLVEPSVTQRQHI
jgi:hypothetical protein